MALDGDEGGLCSLGALGRAIGSSAKKKWGFGPSLMFGGAHVVRAGTFPGSTRETDMHTTYAPAMTAHDRLQFESGTRPVLNRLLDAIAGHGIALDMRGLRVSGAHEYTIDAYYPDAEYELLMTITAYKTARRKPAAIVLAEGSGAFDWKIGYERLFQRRGELDKLVPQVAELLYNKTIPDRVSVSRRRPASERLIASGFESAEKWQVYDFKRGCLEVSLTKDGHVQIHSYVSTVDGFLSSINHPG